MLGKELLKIVNVMPADDLRLLNKHLINLLKLERQRAVFSFQPQDKVKYNRHDSGKITFGTLGIVIRPKKTMVLVEFDVPHIGKQMWNVAPGLLAKVE